MTDIELKRSTGGVYFSTLINEGAKRMRKLMEEDYITLPISTQNPLDIRLGDYVDIPNEGRFCIIETQYPSVNEENGGYDYDLKFEAQYRKWGNKIFKYQPDSGAEELSWKLTANIDAHVEQIKKAINALGAKNPSYKYNGSLDWDIRFDSSIDHKIAKFISFDNINILDGISAIAEAFECEWWIDNDRMGNDKTNYRYLWFGKCEIGDLVEISRDINAESINRSDTGEKTANRIYPFGSTENIPPQYNKELVFNVSRNMGISSTKYPDSIAIIDTARPISHLWFDKSKVEEISHIVELPFNAFNYGDVWIDTNGKDIPTCALVRQDFAELQSGKKFKFLLKDFFVAIVPHFWKNSVESYNYEAQIRLAYKTDYKLDENFTHSTFHYFAETYVDSISGNEQRLKFKDESIEVEIPMTMDVSLTYNHFPILVTIETDKILDKAIYMELRIKVKDKGRLTWNNTGSKIYYDNGVKPTYIIRDLKVEFKTGTQSGITYDAIYDSAVRSDSAGIIIPNVDVDIDDKFYIKGIDELKVPSSYFSPKITNEVGNQTINAIADGRLMLSKDKGSYIDAYRYLNGDKIFIGEKDYDIAQEMPLEEAIEDVVIFEDIKPDHTFKITNIWTTIEDGTDQDGNPTTITRFFFNDELFTANNQFKNEYIIEDKDLSMRFSSGKLNGMTFNIKYVNDSGQPTRWEIIVDEESHLPSAYYMPEIDDEFTMSGLNVLIINDQYLSLAQEELYDVTKDYISKGNIDASAYDVVMFSDVMERGLSLPLGQRVLLKENVFFKNGRESRVIGYEYPLDIPYDSPKYTIGEKASYSRIGDIESKLESIELSVKSNNSNTITTSQVTSAINNIIGSNDELTPVDDKNVFSSLRSVKEFVSKKKSEVINYIWNFTKGITIGQGGATINMDGDAEVESLKSRTFIDADYVETNELISNNIHTTDFVQGALMGIGGAMYQLNGATYAEFDYLTARKGATFAELIIQEYRSIGGALVISQANGEIERVYDYGNGYNIWLKDDDRSDSLFANNDLVRCQYWDRAKNELVYYWTPVSVSEDLQGRYVLTIYKKDMNGVVPQVGDKLVQMGNTTDTSRQGCILLTTENSMPRMAILDGINSPTLSNSNYKGIYGSLDGFTDPYTGKELSGYGMWGENVYLHGDLVVSSTKTTISYELANLNDALTSTKALINEEIREINNRLDGVVTNWFGDDVPTIDNHPADQWTTEQEKMNHIGDTYTNTETTGDNAGKSWRWVQENGEYKWILIADSDAIKALDWAAKAQSTADGKRRVFVNTPTTPYDKGDLWVKQDGEKATLYYSIIDKAEGQFAESDWLVGATDDTAIKDLQIGGTNLLVGTNQGVNNWSFSSSLSSYTAKEISYNGASGVQIIKSNPLEYADWEVIKYPLRSELIKKGKKYHLTFDFMQSAENDGALALSISLNNSNGNNSLTNAVSLNSKDISGVWQHFDVEFTAIANGNKNDGRIIYFNIHRNTNEWKDFAIANLKLEEGNKATTWSPSPEDAESALILLKTETTAKIEKLDDRITQSVSETKTYVDGTKEGLESKITTEVGKISQSVEETITDVNGVKTNLSRTGIDIEKNVISVTTKQFEVKNNQTGEITASVDAFGNLTSNSINAKRVGGNNAITLNSQQDGALKFYHENGLVQLEFGWNGNSLMRYYNDEGIMLWKIGDEQGFITPSDNDNEPYEIEMWKIAVINADWAGVTNTAKGNADNTELYYQGRASGIVATSKTFTQDTLINGYFTRNITPQIVDGGLNWRYVEKYENGKRVDSRDILW